MKTISVCPTSLPVPTPRSCWVIFTECGDEFVFSQLSALCFQGTVNIREETGCDEDCVTKLTSLHRNWIHECEFILVVLYSIVLKNTVNCLNLFHNPTVWLTSQSIHCLSASLEHFPFSDGLNIKFPKKAIKIYVMDFFHSAEEKHANSCLYNYNALRTEWPAVW